MKKFLSIICLASAFLPYAFSATGDTANEIVQLKQKVAALEQLLKDDAAYISKIRAENRSLKRRLRGGADKATARKVVEKKPVMAQSNAESKAEISAAKAKLEKRAEDFDDSDSDVDYNPYGKKRSSVWDHMFPF